MYNGNFDPPPPLVTPGAPGGDIFSAFPGHQRRQQTGMGSHSPWPPVHDLPPPWLQPPPMSNPPAWLNSNIGHPTHSHAHSWGAPSPFHHPQPEIGHNDPWNQPPAPSPWSSSIPTRPMDSTFGQPVTSGFFGANSHPTPNPSYSPWNALIRSTSESAAPPHSAVPHWQWTPSHQPQDITRPRSAGPDRKHTPSHPFRMGTPAHLMPDTWDETNLAKRPRDWRSNYNPRATFLTSLPGLPSILKNQSDVQEFSDPVKRRLSSLLEYNPTGPPISHDLRLDPFDPLNPILHSQTSASEYRHPFGELDMAQFATTPPANMIRLFHPRLPWYIDINQTHPDGITVQDVLSQIYTILQTQIMPRHYWNDALSEADRREIGKTYGKRVALLHSGKEKGILWIDFLCGEVIFEGLSRSKGGLWEIRTKKAPY